MKNFDGSIFCRISVVRLTTIYDESLTVRAVIRNHFQRISFAEYLIKSRQVVISAAKDNLIILSLCLTNFIESH